MTVTAQFDGGDMITSDAGGLDAVGGGAAYMHIEEVCRLLHGSSKS